MGMYKWYRFWKKSGPMSFLSEDYVHFYHWEGTKAGRKEEIEAEVEDWAAKVGGGFNTHYSYGCEEIKKPPQKWVDKRINLIMGERENLKRELYRLHRLYPRCK